MSPSRSQAPRTSMDRKSMDRKSPAARKSATVRNGSRAAAASTDSASVQDYVKVIYSFTEWQDKPITMSQLAARLEVANSSVSEMVRKLVDLGLADHEPYGAVELTASGRTLALSMVRRHRLLETFLVRELGYSWDEVHDEAELLEHTVSELFLERMAQKLGHPDRDPHGDPIPAADGSIELPPARPLQDLDTGHLGTITRISDADPELLRFLERQRIELDETVELLGRRPFGGSLVVKVGTGARARELDLGDEIASALWIRSGRPHAGCTLPG
jgi:DtxR family transcriptional regulator, Mn-dependent transcriptional regulator